MQLKNDSPEFERPRHSYYEQGSTFLNHASSTVPGGLQTDTEPTRTRVGSPIESEPAGHLVPRI